MLRQPVNVQSVAMRALCNSQIADARLKDKQTFGLGLGHQHVCGRQGGMAAEIDLMRRSKPPQILRAIRRNFDESSFGKIVP